MYSGIWCSITCILTGITIFSALCQQRTERVRIPGHGHSIHCLLICLLPPSVSFLGFFSSCVLFFPLISSQDMSNSLQSQTELLTSSIWDHRSLKHTFCRITQIFACLPYSRNELWESDPVRFLASHGFYQVRKNTKVLVSWSTFVSEEWSYTEAFRYWYH